MTTIVQWAKSLVNEDNVKITIILVPAGDNPTCDPDGDWIVWSGGTV